MPRARKVTTASRSAWRWAVQFGMPVLLAAGLLGGVVWVGRLARDDLRETARVRFTSIECEPPGEMAREAFLEEARALAGLPEVLDARDERTAERVRAALEAHPWVERAEVRVRPALGIHADLRARVAVLWVAAYDRAVDASGVLLPATAKREGLPALTGKVRPPAGSDGQPWGDAGVESAAAVAALVEGKASGAGEVTIEAEGGEVVLWSAGKRLLWGRPPGKERPGEPDAAAKAARLARALRAGEDADLRE